MFQSELRYSPVEHQCILIGHKRHASRHLSCCSGCPNSVGKGSWEFSSIISVIISSSTSAFAHSGTRALAYHASASGNTEHCWVIDSGASDHMTSLPSLFTTYHLSSGRDKVSIADGSLVPISGKGDIKLSNTISLSSVLRVPKLDITCFQLVVLQNIRIVQ